MLSFISDATVTQSAAVTATATGAVLGTVLGMALRRRSDTRTPLAKKFLWAVVGPGGAAIVLGSFWLSFETMKTFAEPIFHGGATVAVLVVDGLILVLNAMDALLRMGDRYLWWVAAAGRFFIAASIYLNSTASVTPRDRFFHAIMPGAYALLVEVLIKMSEPEISRRKIALPHYGLRWGAFWLTVPEAYCMIVHPDPAAPDRPLIQDAIDNRDRVRRLRDAKAIERAREFGELKTRLGLTRASAAKALLSDEEARNAKIWADKLVAEQEAARVRAAYERDQENAKAVLAEAQRVIADFETRLAKEQNDNQRLRLELTQKAATIPPAPPITPRGATPRSPQGGGTLTELPEPPAGFPSWTSAVRALGGHLIAAGEAVTPAKLRDAAAELYGDQVAELLHKNTTREVAKNLRKVHGPVAEDARDEQPVGAT